MNYYKYVLFVLLAIGSQAKAEVDIYRNFKGTITSYRSDVNLGKKAEQARSVETLTLSGTEFDHFNGKPMSAAPQTFTLQYRNTGLEVYSATTRLFNAASAFTPSAKPIGVSIIVNCSVANDTQKDSHYLYFSTPPVGPDSTMCVVTTLSLQ